MSKKNEKKKVYCAGPMFSPADRWDQDRLADALEIDGFDTFVPHRDGLEIREIMGQALDPQLMMAVMPFFSAIRKAVFALDLFEVVEGCDCLVFNMNGRVPDGGSVSEASAAYMAGKAVVLYKETPISFMQGQDNPMIDGLSYTWELVGTVEDIPNAVRRAINQADRVKVRDGWSPSFAPMPREAVERGRKIWLLKKSMEWTAGIPELIGNLLTLIQGPETRVEIDSAGTVTVGGMLRLGSLTVEPRAEIQKAAESLWEEFAQDVRAHLESQGG
jgi:nucleoside 2-deoxyribosyltransferase